MGWRKGKPVDALTAPAEGSVIHGVVVLLDDTTTAVPTATIEARSVGWVPDPDNAGNVYIGAVDVTAASGLPVPTTGVSMDINPKKNTVYAIADTSGDAIRWIEIL